MTGMFARVCLVGYANFQGIDAVSYAVSVLATVLETNLIDAAAVTRVLADQSVLVILDNLESLDAEQLVSLLDAAKEWSEAGESRVLLTTRTPDLRHHDYQVKDPDARREKPWLPHKHVSLQLEGLRPDDAVNYFQSLLKLPPAPRLDLPFRNDLLALFELVQRLPLAIGLLAAQLKDRQVLDVRKELEELLVQSPDNPLLASLNLSINRLDPKIQKWIECLGVFQGGAMEPELLGITGIAKVEWSKIKLQLETTGIIQVESHLGITAPFIKFHPTLSIAMWSRLTEAKQHQLRSSHRHNYYKFSRHLYFKDQQRTLEVRAIVQRELPNLMFAVRDAIKTGEDFTAEFVTQINKFLDNFGRRQDIEELTQQMHHFKSAVGSQNWFLNRTNVGVKLQSVGCYKEAEAVFQEILLGLGSIPSYKRCLTLNNIGRCHESIGQSKQAIAQYELGLKEAAMLEQTNNVKRQTGTLQADLGDVLREMGKYDYARASYEVSLAIKKEIGGDPRGEAVIQGQLGTLALVQNNLTEAVHRYKEARDIFQQLNEPTMEAVAWHQLGITFQELHQWENAEQAFRQSAKIREFQGLIGGLNGAVATWNHLAILSKDMGKLEESEDWYHKAIKADRENGDKVLLLQHLNNFANLLQMLPDRLTEAQQVAEESLVIKQTLDPAVAQIWNTYSILAEISDKQGDPAKAKEYRHLSRTTRANFAGTEYELRQHAQLIDGVARAINDAEVRQQLESEMENAPSEWQNLNAAIRQILNGQRNEDILCEGLDAIDSQIVLAILDQVKR